MIGQRNTYRLAVEVDVDARTVSRWLKGDRVLPAVHHALVAAAKRLKIEVPPAALAEPHEKTRKAAK